MAQTATRQSDQRSTFKLKQTSNPNEALFGSHLTLDGYGADRAALNNMDLVFTALNDLPEILDMTKIMTPYVIRFDGNNKKDAGGYSGFVMIAESHISIHTFPAKGFVTIDVYTCQGEVDAPTCNAYFKRIFGVKNWEQHIIKRGRKYGAV
ncbi:MAG: adenosylmethionine decarboxylase [Patescibacteria group bacterium]